MFGWFEEDEDDKKLLENIVKYYQPSMKVLSDGAGSWMLTMSASDGRRTARNKMPDAELAELKNSGRK